MTGSLLYKAAISIAGKAVCMKHDWLLWRRCCYLPAKALNEGNEAFSDMYTIILDVDSAITGIGYYNRRKYIKLNHALLDEFFYQSLIMIVALSLSLLVIL